MDGVEIPLAARAVREDEAPVRQPRRPALVAGQAGDAARLAAAGIDDVEIEAAVVDPGGEGQLPPVGRPRRVALEAAGAARPAHDRARVAAVGAEGPDLIADRERDALGQPATRRDRGRRGWRRRRRPGWSRPAALSRRGAPRARLPRARPRRGRAGGAAGRLAPPCALTGATSPRRRCARPTGRTCRPAPRDGRCAAAPAPRSGAPCRRSGRRRSSPPRRCRRPGSDPRR